MMPRARVLVGVITLILLLIQSTRSFIESGGTTIEPWIYLLLTPFPLALTLMERMPWDVEEDSEESVLVEPEVDVEVEPREVDDPAESGFDIPIL